VSPRDRPYRGKRLLDLAIFTLAAVPSLLIGAGCGVAIRLTSPGPIFFRQERIGRGGRPFHVWKFRTMVDEPDNPIFPQADRITVVGGFLRRSSLDELPQLINVARGEMSIVGPRPTLAYQVARYDDRQRRRLSVRPGITGLAQVRGRNSIAWAERIEHDLEYLERQSLGLDLRIMWWTAGALASRREVGDHPPDDPLATLPDAVAGTLPTGAPNDAPASDHGDGDGDRRAQRVVDQE
jgi:lipopolysaccharide/colanic/teichoic acid biosynthesis glycosyltransferase